MPRKRKNKVDPSKWTSLPETKSELSRSELIEIFEETREISQTKFPYIHGDDIDIYTMGRPIKLEPISRHPDIEITERECINECSELHNQNPDARIVVVNSASQANIGGGVSKGSSAQEEFMCRCSNLYEALCIVDSKVGYPLHGKVKGIYIPRITFFRDKDYSILDRPFEVDVLCLFSTPRISKKYHKEISQETFEKVYANIFRVLIDVCYRISPDYLVMVPVGCGCFGHDPDVVSAMMKEYFSLYQSNVQRGIKVACYNTKSIFNSFSWTFR